MDANAVPVAEALEVVEVQEATLVPLAAELPSYPTQSPLPARPPPPPVTEGGLDQLPPYMEARYTNDGRVFYIDHQTQTTSWERPTIAPPPASPPIPARPVRARSRVCVRLCARVHVRGGVTHTHTQLLREP